MNPEQNQGELTHDELRSALGFATTMGEEIHGFQNPDMEEDQPSEAPQDAQEAPTEEQPPEPTNEPQQEEPDKLAEFEDKMTKGMEDLKAEFEKVRKEDAAAHAKELANINKSLKEILNAK